MTAHERKKSDSIDTHERKTHDYKFDTEVNQLAKEWIELVLEQLQEVKIRNI